MDLGIALRHARYGNNKNIKTVAKDLGIHPNTILQIEKGINGVSDKLLDRLCEYYVVDKFVLLLYSLESNDSIYSDKMKEVLPEIKNLLKSVYPQL